MSDDGRSPDDPLSRFLTAETGGLMVFREVLSSVLAVAFVGLILFAVAGVWPPMVAVESGSMEPHMERGDLVFITEPERFSPEYAYGDTGIVTFETGVKRGYSTFGAAGSVVVYRPPSDGGPPIIHRARFHVREGENWIDRANPDYLPADSCERVPACPAPYAGFITKGDANAQYDQVSGIAPVVRAEWVKGIARVRVPYLGYVRLLFSEAALAEAPPTDHGPVETEASVDDADAHSTIENQGGESGSVGSVVTSDASGSAGRASGSTGRATPTHAAAGEGGALTAATG